MATSIKLGFIKALNSEDSIIIDHNISYSENASVNYDIIVPRASVGAIYTYNSTKERSFPVEIEIIDYDGSGKLVDNAKKLIRSWRLPTIKNGIIVSPPPILEFQYMSMTDDTITQAIRCVMLDYSIRVEDKTGWNIDEPTKEEVGKGKTVASLKGNPKAMLVTMNLAEVENRF